MKPGGAQSRFLMSEQRIKRRRSELTVEASVKVGGFTLSRVGRLAREVHGDADEVDATVAKLNERRARTCTRLAHRL